MSLVTPTRITAPFFEIGPKNLLRRDAIEALALAAGAAGREHGVTVLITVPAAMVAPIHDLDAGIVVLAQGMSTDGLGPTMDVVTAEALVDAGAAGVMLNHDARPLDAEQLALALARARETGLQTVVCAATQAEAARHAGLRPDVILFEPPELIGVADADAARPWIPDATAAIRAASAGAVLAMHAGGVATPEIAAAIMAAGADGTGSTSGVLGASDVAAAARAFIAATRSGWDAARPTAAPRAPHAPTRDHHPRTTAPTEETA